MNANLPYAIFVQGTTEPVAAFKHKTDGVEWANSKFHGRFRVETHLDSSSQDSTLSVIPNHNREPED